MTEKIVSIRAAISTLRLCEVLDLPPESQAYLKHAITDLESAIEELKYQRDSVQ